MPQGHPRAQAVRHDRAGADTSRSAAFLRGRHGLQQPPRPLARRPGALPLGYFRSSRPTSADAGLVIRAPILNASSGTVCPARVKLTHAADVPSEGSADFDLTPSSFHRRSPGPPRRALAAGRSRPAGLDAPGVGDRLARLEHDEVVAADEGVGRARHRLDRDRFPVALAAERVAGEHLKPRAARAGP